MFYLYNYSKNGGAKVAIMKVSSKGQVVIPKEIRKKFSLEPNTRVEFREINGQIILIPLPSDPVEASFGIVKSEKKVREIMKEVRKEEISIEK